MKLLRYILLAIGYMVSVVIIIILPASIVTLIWRVPFMDMLNDGLYIGFWLVVGCIATGILYSESIDKDGYLKD